MLARPRIAAGPDYDRRFPAPLQGGSGLLGSVLRRLPATPANTHKKPPTLLCGEATLTVVLPWTRAGLIATSRMETMHGCRPGTRLLHTVRQSAGF